MALGPARLAVPRCSAVGRHRLASLRTGVALGPLSAGTYELRGVTYESPRML